MFRVTSARREGSPRTAAPCPTPRTPVARLFIRLALALMLALGLGTPAAAVTLVSNLQDTTSTSTIRTTSGTGSQTKEAQGFITGATAYTLTSVKIPIDNQGLTLTSLTAALHEKHATNDEPGNKVADLTLQGTIATGQARQTLTYNAPANTNLATETTYFLVLTVNGRVGVHMRTRDPNTETGLTGWTIHNTHHQFDGTDWETTGDVAEGYFPWEIELEGEVTPLPTTDHWSATLTVRDILGVTKGCSNSNINVHCSSTSHLTDDDFTLDGTDYAITNLYVRNNNKKLSITFDTTLATAAQSLILEIDGEDFAFEDADAKTDTWREWNSSGLTWNTNDTVAVKLKSVDTADETAPTFSSAEVTADAPKSLVITFNEALDTSSEPAPGAFTVKVDGTAEDTPTGVSISGSTVTLTLATALDNSQSNVTVDYTNPGSSNNPLQDAADNEVATFTGQSVTNDAPACPDTTNHPGDALWTACLTLGQASGRVGYGQVNSYGALDPSSFTEVNDFVVTQLSQNTSMFYLALATSDLNVAEYWVLQVGDTTLNLADATLTNSLFSWTRPAALNWDSATTVNNPNVGNKISVSLTQGNRPPVASDAAVNMDEGTSAYTFSAADFGYSDADNDDLAGVEITSIPGSGEGDLKRDGSAITSSDLPQAISVTNGVLANTLTFEPDGTDDNGEPYATFTYTVFDGEEDSASAATMSVNVLNTPDVTDVSVTSTPDSGTADTYARGEVIQVTVTFDEEVTVTGSPLFRLRISDGTTINNRDAAYVSGSGSNALVFGYTVVAADDDDNGIWIPANALMLNSGTIQDGDSNNADITHAQLGQQNDHKVDGSIDPPDTTPPTVESAEVTSAEPKELVITFNEALDTSSEPAPGAFTVKVDGTAEDDPTDVSISGSTVTLTLATALDNSQSNVTVDYTNPGSSNNPLQDAADNEVATFTGQSVTNDAPACPDTTSHPGDAFWTACLTVGQGSGFIGYRQNIHGALDLNNFDVGGRQFTVTQLDQDTSLFNLVLNTSGLSMAEDWVLITDGWVLQVGDTTLNLADATLTNNLFRWTRPAALNWDSATTVNNPNVGNKISVSLTQGNRPPVASDVTVDMDEDATYTFSVADFGYSDADSDDLVHVTIVSEENAGFLQLDGNGVSANDEISVADITAGKLKFSAGGDDRTGSPFATFTFKVNDGTTDSTDTYTMGINVLNTPDVTQVAVTSTPNSGTANTYGRGEVIQVTVTFDEAVTVTGSPFFRLRISDGTTINDRDATLLSGSGTTALVFGYTVVAADDDDNGIYIESNALMLDGGTIQDDDGHNADITHAQLGTQSSHLVDGSLDPPDTTAPTFSSALVTAAAPKSLVITFNEALDTGSVPAAGAFTVKVDGTAEDDPTGVSISGAEVTLTLATALDASQTSVTVDYTKPGSDPLKDAANNEVATFTNQAVDNQAPACPTGQPAGAFWTACLTVGKVVLGPNAFYGYATFGNNTGGDLSDKSVTYHGQSWEVAGLSRLNELFKLSFESAFATSNDRLMLQVGGQSFDFDGDMVEPDWTVPAELRWDDSNLGDKISVSLRGNRLPTSADKTVETDEDTAYTFAATDFAFDDEDADDTALASVKVVTLPDQNHGALTLSNAAVTANQVIDVADIGNLVFTPAADWNGSASFTFTVNDGEGDSTATYTMTVNVDSVPEVTDVAVTSTPNSGTADTYGRGETIRVTVTFDEDVTVTGSPVINVEVGSNSRPAAYVSGSATTELVFEYTVVAADSDSDGIEIAANALSGGTIQSVVAHSNDADLDHAALAAQSSHQVDGSLVSNTPATGAPEITGDLIVGRTLTAGSGTIADADGLPSTTFPTGYSFQWVRQEDASGTGATDIAGETARTYTLVAADEGKWIAVKVTFDDGDGTSETRTGVTSAAVTVLSSALVFTPEAVTVTEGGQATYTVALDAAPVAEVTVSIVSDDEDAATVSPASLTFTPTDWGAKTVTVTGVADDAEDDRAVTITHSGDGVETGTVSVTVTAESTLEAPRKEEATTLLRRHADRFASVSSGAALGRLQGLAPPTTVNAQISARNHKLDASWNGEGAKGSGWAGWSRLFYGWVEGPGDGAVYDLYLGVDWRAPDGRYVIGGMLGHEGANLRLDEGGGRFRSRITQVGLYGATYLSETLILDGALAYGFGRPELSQGGVTAKYDTRRLTLRADLTGGLSWRDGAMVIEPQLGVLHVRENLGAFTDSAGVSGAAETLRLTRLGIGPRLTWALPRGTFTGRARVNWDRHNLEGDGDKVSDLSASLDARLRYDLEGGLSAEFFGAADGIGLSGDQQTYTAGVSVKFRF